MGFAQYAYNEQGKILQNMYIQNTTETCAKYVQSTRQT